MEEVYYTALEEMRLKNCRKFPGVEVGPKQPEWKEKADGLSQAALSFLHKSCRDLRHSAVKAAEEERTGEYRGKSSNEGDIPYNMQMDIERLTLEQALENFLQTGATQDAFCVYFCYLEMYFGTYGKNCRMIELLSEFESNASSLLMKHRDHYVHSVYVFALGLAVYETNSIYRAAYEKYYKNRLEPDQTMAHHYLKYWGLTSLFHDIGYPFELPFEQVESYFQDREENEKERHDFKREGNPYIAYHEMKDYVRLTGEQKDVLKNLYGELFENTDELFAYDLEAKLSEVYFFTRESMKNVLESKPTEPNKFGYFMDHAYFSATVLFKNLCSSIGEENITRGHIDALTAIILHNSLYKFSVAFYKDKERNKPFRMQLHPLAYMLMLCDELQCWDRTAYGRNSRTQLHPMDCHFTFENDGIRAVYLFDPGEQDKIDRYERDYSAGKKGKLKAYSDMVHGNDFQHDIEKIVALNTEGTISLETSIDIAKPDTGKSSVLLSESNFLHLYNFAVVLNARYSGIKEDSSEDRKEAVDSFNHLSLEYKMSNVRQANEFRKHLERVGCFYTDKQVGFEMIKSFSDFSCDEMNLLGEEEHNRWVKEKREMAWIPSGELTEVIEPKKEDSPPDKKRKKATREQLRMHYDFMPYKQLSEAEKEKDTEPLNMMLKKLAEFDGLRVYRYR